MIRKEDILVVLPAYNEATHLRTICEEIKALHFPNICIVNDGSTDETSQMAFDSSVVVLHHVINRGVGAATDTGLKYAKQKKYKAVITLDADGQHKTTDIEVLFDKYQSTQADLIIGNRFLLASNQIPNTRKLFNKVANIFTGIYAEKFISDTQSGIKLFSEKAIHAIQIDTDGYEFCSEIIIKASQQHLHIEEVPVHVYYTSYSMAKGQGLWMGFKTVFNLFANLLVRDKD